MDADKTKEVKKESTLPPWMTFDRRIEVWELVLSRELRCDRPSVQELFLLAQHSRVGAELANSIIAKLIKKIADGEKLNKPSAYLHTAVLNARQYMDHQTTWYQERQRELSSASAVGWRSIVTPTATGTVPASWTARGWRS